MKELCVHARKRNTPNVHVRKTAAGALPNEESEDFLLIRRFVRTGARRGDQVEVLSGLSGGETLVVEEGSNDDR